MYNFVSFVCSAQSLSLSYSFAWNHLAHRTIIVLFSFFLSYLQQCTCKLLDLDFDLDFLWIVCKAVCNCWAPLSIYRCRMQWQWLWNNRTSSSTLQIPTRLAPTLHTPFAGVHVHALAKLSRILISLTVLGKNSARNATCLLADLYRYTFCGSHHPAIGP